MNPLVTVIVPCYNQGKWLSESLDAIFASTYKNLEVIVVDDGSTDPFTMEMFDHFDHPGVKLVRQTNQGLCAVRNNAVKISHGEYILSVDSDDLLAPDYIQHAIDCFRFHPDVDQVGADYVLLDDATKKTSEPVHGLRNAGYVTSKIMCNNIMTSNYVISRRLFDAMGGFSLALTRLAIEDVDFTMRAFSHGYKIYALPEVGLQYRQHGMSMNKNQKKRKRAKYIAFGHNMGWFLKHPMYILPFFLWRKFGKWLDNMPYAKR